MSQKDVKKTLRLELLGKDAQNEFRADYRQTETEIQKNIAVYLSALVVATGWVFGPQSKPVEQLFLGNEGLNLFGFIILIAINVVFTCFLTYKSIQVHEIMQFVITLSPSDSPLVHWEAWRRSGRRSLSRGTGTRVLYFLVISLIPVWVSGILLWGTGHYIWQQAEDTVAKIEQIEKTRTPLDASAQTNSQSSVQGGSATQPPTPSNAVKSKEISKAFNERVSRTMHLAKFWWITVLVFHLIPAWFFTVTWLRANSKWKEIGELKNMPDFNLDISKENEPPDFSAN
jgi:hypothetical protein